MAVVADICHTYDIDSDGRPQRIDSLDAAGAVVIAGSDNDSQPGHGRAQLHHLAGEQSLSLCRRLCHIENVARNEQRVGFFGAADTYDLV